MQKIVDLSIIILNFNARDYIIDCIHSIEKSKWGKYKWELIIVDNASSDGSVEALKNLQKDIDFKLIINKKNLGFSKGNNLGVPHAKCRYILFLNPDTKVNPDTLSYMIKFMDDFPDAGASTCEIKLASGQLDEASHRGFPTPWNALCHFSGLEKAFPKSRFFSGYRLGHLSRNTVHEIEALSGAFMMVRQEAGEQVGWWDEDYFLYGEDIDFCYRLKQAGWKIMYVPEVSIIHYWGISSGMKKETRELSVATKVIRLRAAKASAQAMRIFYKKHYTKRYPTPIMWPVNAGIWLLEKYRQLSS